jgi:hypothetical protein
MSLIDKLIGKIMDESYFREDETYVITRDEDPHVILSTNPDIKAFYHPKIDDDGNDILFYQTMSIDEVIDSKRNVKNVREAVSRVYRGADELDLYIRFLEQAIKDFGVARHDIIYDHVIDNENIPTIDIYEKLGRYYTSGNGEGFDITEFFVDHYKEVLGLRDSEIKNGYRLNVITFMDELDKLDRKQG